MIHFAAHSTSERISEKLNSNKNENNKITKRTFFIKKKNRNFFKIQNKEYYLDDTHLTE